MSGRGRGKANLNPKKAVKPKADFTAVEVETFSNEWQDLIQNDLSSADYYFNSYAHFGIHEEMLKDTIRTGAYQRAILNNRNLFQGKVVLDVGSGSGILSMFAARAGAKKVYGIECSEIVDVARKIVKANQLDDVVEFIQGKAEEVELPVEKVDIIISEWMGYFLLYESMLDTVLFARDKWLVEGGLIFPDKATLYLAGIEDGDYKEEKIGYWDNVYGFNYSVVKNIILEEPLVDCIEDHVINTSVCPIIELDLNTCTVKDVDFVSRFKLTVNRKDFVHALVSWFDISFSKCMHPVSFTTGPQGKRTHWKQTVFYIKDCLVAMPNESIEGIIAVRKNASNPRDLDIKIGYKFEGAIQKPVEETLFYRLR